MLHGLYDCIDFHFSGFRDSCLFYMSVLLGVHSAGENTGKYGTFQPTLTNCGTCKNKNTNLNKAAVTDSNLHPMLLMWL